MVAQRLQWLREHCHGRARFIETRLINPASGGQPGAGVAEEGLSPMTLRAARFAGAAAQPEPPRQDDVAGVRGALYRLFPAAPPRPGAAPWRRRALTAAARS
jgi:hypothetical protein